MKCNVVKNWQNQVVAAYPTEVNGEKVNIALESGQRVVELQFTANELCDPELFYQACSNCC